MENDSSERLIEIQNQEKVLAEEKKMLLAAASRIQSQNSMSNHFARFWAKGVSGPFSCWKFSNDSQEEAQQLANERVVQIVEKFRSVGKPPDNYEYCDQRLREPVIQEVHDAVVSRNAYGCLVLNTSNVMFVDIDFPVVKEPGFLEQLKNLFKETPKRNFEEEIVNHIEDWTSQNSGWGWRIYRTFAGLRLIATQDCFIPESTNVQTIFQALGADTRYRVLCKVQKCFRARLTPKPWRCNSPIPKARWPWKSENEARDFDNWQVVYEHKAKDFATCRLIKTIGHTAVHAAVLPIIELHDQVCRVGTDLPLA